MDQFEYVTTLVSFVIAFGVSRLLAGWAHQFTRRSQSRIYPLQVAVSTLILVALLQNTWAMWLARDAVWTFGLFLLYMLAVMALVGASALIHPPLDHPSSIRDYYFECDMRSSASVLSGSSSAESWTSSAQSAVQVLSCRTA